MCLRVNGSSCVIKHTLLVPWCSIRPWISLSEAQQGLTLHSLIVWYLWAPLVTQMVKNPPAVLETRIQSLGQEDPLEKGMATHSSVLAWEISWTEEPDRSRGLKKSQRTEWLTLTLIFFFLRNYSTFFCFPVGGAITQVLVSVKWAAPACIQPLYINVQMCGVIQHPIVLTEAPLLICSCYMVVDWKG